MIIIKGIVSGLIATFIFDIYQISLSYAYNIKKPRWDLVGRYFIYLKENIYFHENIENNLPLKNELLIGYLVHYIIGIFFGIIYVLINMSIFKEPSLILALSVGFVTVLGGWCIMMPYVHNIGFFALKKENNKKIMTQNLIAHFIFGVGLYIGAII